MPPSQPHERKVLCVVGTRPEAIKMAPVVRALERAPGMRVTVVATAQHRDLLDGVLRLFGIRPAIDLDLMRHDQRLPELTAKLISALDQALEAEAPDMVLAQGDTTTVFAAALTAFYRRIPFGHVEAGLRTGEIDKPFPEEMNRVLTSPLARWHFAPTRRAAENLLREGVASERVFVTGNTVIDALFFIRGQQVPIGVELDRSKKLVLVTSHRREHFGDAFLEICRALRALADRNPDVQILYPLHPNPNITEPAQRELSANPRIILCKPLEYAPFVSAMQAAYLILTDSGGVQEEAPALAKPVLVLRDKTERPEAVEAGVVQLVGPHYQRILDESEKLLGDATAYAAMAKGISPYGDGLAAGRIVDILMHGSAAEIEPWSEASD